VRHIGAQIEQQKSDVSRCGRGSPQDSLVPSLIEALKCEGAGDILVVVVGVIPPNAYDFLK
jgi:methylmalonyl-CoA mutase cobalamin-binding domain/chain